MMFRQSHSTRSSPGCLLKCPERCVDDRFVKSINRSVSVNIKYCSLSQWVGSPKRDRSTQDHSY